ncbi:MAG: tetratricopeptide repeat protein [Acidobacteria bacterium]|nr:tetratricopeptide repeat protein [Acidobacteriota bacterium]MBV9478802.1 tetratricopeptide repeat protein [Acidobacteriota bacterium]
MTRHYDEWVLQDYLDDPDSVGDRAELEEHLAGCAECRAVLDELRAFEAALAGDELWELAGDAPPREEETPEALRALADLFEREDREASELLGTLLASPASFRRANITSQPAMRTAGVVRRLCSESRTLRERQPMHALVVADAAIAIGDQLSPERYPSALIDELRAAAWLERANVLRYLGRYPEALDALDIAERGFARSPVAAYSRALVDYVRAVVFVETERLDEGRRLARNSARVFRQFGEDERFIHAKIVEASVLFDQHRYREARDLFLSLVRVATAVGQGATLARLYQNVATCHLRLNELDAADTYFERALSLYRALGLETERVRTQWSVGCVRIARGDIAVGLGQLREARREFAELGLRSDAALVTLDLAETLLATGTRPAIAEAAELCGALVESFTAVGMTGHALTALAFLREAFAAGTATPDLVRHIRQYIESLPDQRDLPFLPPPRL